MNAPRSPGRPASPARASARAAGLTVYSGRPCKRGHAGARYVSTAACVDCACAGDNPGASPDLAAIAALILI